jgi:hypothetical protein
MTFQEDETTGQPEEWTISDDPPVEPPGLPWPRTWPGVYLVVFGSFVTWVTLLIILERVFP